MTDEIKASEEVNEEKFCGDVIPYTTSTTFDELEAERQAREMAHDIEELAEQSQMLTNSVISSFEIDDKPAAIVNIANGLIERVKKLSPSNRAQPLTDKIINTLEDVTKAKMKTEDGVAYPASDFAFVPDKEKPSSWKLRLAQGKPGNITRAQLGAAAAALSPGGFRGNRVKLPEDAVSKVKARIRREYKKLGVEDMPTSVKQQNAVSIWKSETGQYHWMTVYSNAYRDNDNPPEIISHQSHIDNNKAINDGDWAMPELWLWHIPYAVGKAVYHYYDENTRLAVAAGIFDTGKEDIAQALIESNWSEVSHGMPIKEIERDQKDKSIFIRHRTKEISFLPPNKAANRLTFNIIKGDEGMNDEQKNALLALIGDDRVKDIETALSDTKEVTEQVEKEVDEDVTEQEIPLTRDEIAEAIKAIVTPLQSEIKALKERLAEKEAEPETPANELLKMLQAASVIGKEETKVDGRTALAKSKPAEQEEIMQGGLMGMFQPAIDQNNGVVQ